VVKRPPRRGLLLVGITFLIGLGLLGLGVSYHLAPIAVTLALMGAGAVAQAHLSAMFVAAGFLVLAVGTVAALSSGVRRME